MDTIGARIRYPDVAVYAGSLDQTTRTLTGAVPITATTDRVDKLTTLLLPGINIGSPLEDLYRGLTFPT